MDLSRHLILLNGQPKTMQIDIIKKNMSNGYLVRFKNNPKSYNYSCNKCYIKFYSRKESIANEKLLAVFLVYCANVRT